MRAFANFTNEPIEFKTWSVSADLVKLHHFGMLKSHDIHARWSPDQEWFTAANGRSYRYGMNGRAEFDTTNKEQEVVLKLLYGQKLLLMIVEVVLPNSFSQCVLREKDNVIV